MDEMQFIELQIAAKDAAWKAIVDQQAEAYHDIKSQLADSQQEVAALKAVMESALDAEPGVTAADVILRRALAADESE